MRLAIPLPAGRGIVIEVAMTGPSIAPPAPSGQGALTISAIMPVYNGAATIRRSLDPLLTMQRVGEIAQIIVVDDGSTDASAEIATGLGVRVVSSGGRLGPGGARNVAAPLATGDILWFVDADVVVHADAGRVLNDALRRTGAAAVFGAYDDDPPAANFLSQYKNLVHRYYHSEAAGDAETFWAGCGAIRKQIFLEVGGFDQMRYPKSSIEDIELGWRLRQRGLRIHIEPALQATHLKVWRLRNLLYTEILLRAVPWSRLIQSRGGWSNTLNIRHGERLRALLAVCAWLATVLAAGGLAPAWLVIAMLVGIGIANRKLFAFFRRRRGSTFALGGVLFHQVYYLYSSAAFAWCWIERRWSGAREAFHRRADAA